jgi:hypothetical protein
MFGVAHVEPKDVCSGVEQPAQHFGFFGGRSKRANNLGLAHPNQD